MTSPTHEAPTLELGQPASASIEDETLPAPRAPTAAPRPRASSRLVGTYMSQWWQRVKAGDLGSLPIIVGLVVIAVVFGLLDDTFLVERNFTNLLLQMAPLATIAIGVVFVLLLGEIDLSVAYVSAVGGVTMTLLLRPDSPGWPWWAAVGYRPAHDDPDRSAPGPGHHQGRCPVVRGHAGRPAHLVRRGPDPDHPVFDVRDHPDPGRRSCGASPTTS